MDDSRFLIPGQTCWRVEQAGQFSVLIDGCDYYRALKRCILQAREQVLMIGWDFDTRIEFEPEGKTLEGPNKLGPFLNWLTETRPDLEVRLLRWNLGLWEALKRGETPLFLLRWMMGEEVHIRLDAAHPPAASHHQKFVVIDDALAFCGGIDLTKGRWDTREHLDRNPSRRSGRGAPLGPWHDATTCVDGEAAKALGDLGRIRWKRATGEELTAPESKHTLWPEDIEPTLTGVELGISRTMGSFDKYPETLEIETLTLKAIREARKTLYIESQYFASRRIAEAMIERLQEEDGPEIVVVTPESQAGWLEEKTMGSARAKLLSLVEKSDPHDRFRIFYPVTAKGTPIYVHAKIMAVDDRLLKIGSANLNNRSMGYDTECDISLEAGAEDGHLQRTITGVRNDLLAEHLGLSVEDVEKRLEEADGSIIAVIDSGREGRHLEPLPIRQLDAADEVMSEQEMLDPIRPFSLRRAIRRRIGL